MVKFYNLLKDPTYRVGALYSASSILSTFISMITGLILIKWIEPAELGLWQSLSLLQMYMPFLELGIPSGLNRELPYQYGKGNVQKGLDLAATSLFYMRAIGYFTFAITVIATFVLQIKNVDEKIIVGIFIVGVMASLNCYDRYLTVTYRSNEAFKDLSYILMIDSIVRISLLPVVYFFNYYGILIYVSSVLIIHVLIKHLRRPIKIKSKFIRDDFIELSKTGLPVFGMFYIRNLINSFNRLIILRFGGVLQVGLFTPVAAIGTMIDVLPSILGNFFFPKMNILIGKTNDPKLLWPIALKLNLLMIFLAIPFILIGWFLIPYFMLLYFPKYVDSTYAMQLFTFNMLFAGTLVSHNVMYAIKSYKMSYIFNITELILRFGLPFLAVTLLTGNLLTIVVQGYLLSSLLLFIFNLILIRTILFKSK